MGEASPAKLQRKREEKMADVTSDLLAAVLAATPDRKAMALRVLRGEDGGVGGEKKNALPERFVTQRELVKMLGVSAISLWRWKVPRAGLAPRRGRQRGDRPVARQVAAVRSSAQLGPSRLRRRATRLAGSTAR